MKELKELVEKIIDYTKTWSITENEWYYNIECVRKPNCIKDEQITWEEFEMAIREEILYDLVFHNASGLYNQMEDDACNYSSDYEHFINDSKTLEKEVQKYITDFKIRRYNDKGEEIK